MKNLKFSLIALALVIGISGCKKEEKAVVDAETETNNIIKSRLIGKWQWVKDEVTYYKNGSYVNTEIREYGAYYTDYSITEYKSDGTWINNVTYKDGTKDVEMNGIFTVTNNGKTLTESRYNKDGTLGRSSSTEIKGILPDEYVTSYTEDYFIESTPAKRITSTTYKRK